MYHLIRLSRLPSIYTEKWPHRSTLMSCSPSVMTSPFVDRAAHLRATRFPLLASLLHAFTTVQYSIQLQVTRRPACSKATTPTDVSIIPQVSTPSSALRTPMYFIRPLSAALLLAIVGKTTAQDDFVEPKDVAVTDYNSAIIMTALSDKRNYAPSIWAPICISDVYRVREAVTNATREIFFEVNGCAVKKPQIKRCKASSSCIIAPFEIRVTGPNATPQFDPVAMLKKGKATQTPYRIESIGRL